MFTIRAAAQQKTFFEVASVGAGYQSSPTIDVPGQTAVLYTSTVAKMPFVLKNGDIILAGATVQHHQMYRSADGLFAPEIIGRGRIGYSHAGVIAGFVHSIGDGASLSLVAMPYIASDFGDITSDDFRCEFVTLLSHKFNEVLTYKYGTMLAYSFAGPDLWPLLGLEWRPVSKSSVTILIPQFVRYKYQITPRADVGISYQCQLATYRMSDARESIYLEQQLCHVLLSAGIFLTKNLYLRIQGGHSIASYARFYRKDDLYDYKIALWSNTKRHPLDAGYKNGLAAELKISYLVPTN